MKILFVTHYAELLGANRSMLKLICLLKDQSRDINITVAVPTLGPLTEELQSANISYIVIPMYWWTRTTYSWNKGFLRLLDYCNKQRRNIIYIWRTRKQLKDGCFDLVYSNSVVIITGWLISVLLHIPHVWHFRETLTQFDMRLPRFLGRLVLNHHQTRAYVLISKYMEQYYSSILPKNRVHMIYNGVDVQTTGNAYNTNKLSLINARKYNIGIVGAVAEQKNQLDVIKSLALLLCKGYDAQLHVVGPIDEDYMTIITREVDKSVLMHVSWYGQCTDVTDIIRNMDVCVTPSRDEAFGRVTIEYMLCRIPVIASRSGANPEFVKDRETGLLYDLHNVDQLTYCIEYLLTNSAETQSLVDSAYDNVLLNYSATKNSEEIYKLINEINRA